MDDSLELLEDGEITESVDDSLTKEQFLLSRATREPKTICSDESSNDNSDNSDDDSDNQCSKAKRVKPQPPPPPSRNQVPNKYKVWSTALQEETLMENLNRCDVDMIDRERSVESYNYKRADKRDYSQDRNHMTERHEDCEDQYHDLDDDYGSNNDSEQYTIGTKRSRGDIKKRLGPKKASFRPRNLPNLAVTVEDSAEEVANEIARNLREQKKELILNIVLVLGKAKAIELYDETRKVEHNGGMLLMSEERRRTSGGVYLLLLKRDDSIPSEQMKQIWEDDVSDFKRKRKKASRRKRKTKLAQFKETLIREKLLSLNTASAVPPCEQEMGQGDHLRSTDVLEEGEVEVELNVTNPPPSPASPPPHSDDEETHIPSDNLGRTLIRYDDDDEDDCLDVDVDPDDMDVF